MAFCIPKPLVDAFIAKLKSGEITPERLSNMTSAERNAFFVEHFGEANATKVNAQFESKLLLKNQQRGIINWVKKVTGMKPEAKRDLQSRVERMEEVLTPETADVFLNDLVNQRLGVTVTQKEAANIAALSKDVATFRDAMEKGGDRMDYGRARIEFEDYVAGLKDEATAVKLFDYVKPENYLEGIGNVFGFLKSMKATFDNSAIGRQGLKVLFTEPDIWVKNSAKTFLDAFKVIFRNENVMKEIRADIVSRPNSINGLYKKEKLAVGVVEEPFPVTTPEKIPGFGKFFKASETAFTGFAYRTRVDVFDRLVLTAEQTGAEITGLGKYVNSLTGRGTLGRLEPSADFVNKVFFSARFARSNVDALTFHVFNRAKMEPFARKEAAKSSMKIIGGIATALGVSKAICPECVDFDPRSTNFGRVRVGNTRFDFSGGMGSYVTLAARLLTGQVKSSTTDVITDLNDKTQFKPTTAWDVWIRWLENKLSPGMQAIKMMAEQETYEGDPLTPGNVAFEVLSPIIVENFVELAEDPRSANIVLAMLADFMGVGTNTWGPEVEWHNKTTKEMLEFRELKGEDLFKQANESYNQRWTSWLDRAKKNKDFINLSDKDKILMMQRKRREFKKEVFIEFDFEPTRGERKELPVIE